MSFSPIAELLADTYDVSILEVNTLGMVFTVNEIPGCIIVMALFSKMRPKNVMKIGTFLLFVGGWLRQPIMAESLYGTKDFYWLILGQTLISLS